MGLQLLKDEFVEAHTVEDWGQNKATGWFARVLEINGHKTVAMLPPNGKLWRADIPEETSEQEQGQ